MTTSTTLLVSVFLKGLAIGRSTTEEKKHTLSAAGFRRVLADNPEKEAHLKSLPATGKHLTKVLNKKVTQNENI
jgi:hypothetical protein